MIQFAPNLGWWSPAVFWYVIIGIVACLGFTVVVIIGGAMDLAYLLKSMDEPNDDGPSRQ